MFDLQAHRGGIGLTVENTLAAFRTALALGVTTLECDVNISADGVPMVTHDRRVSPQKNLDTGPLTAGDPEFPYVGRFVCRLSEAQLKTLDCGSLAQPDFPGQRRVPGEPMPTFAEVLALAAPTGVRVNVEAKFDVVHPRETAPRQRFVDTTVETIRRAGMTDRVSIQSFDWQVLRMVGWAEPSIRRYALTSPTYLEPGRVGHSPWLAGLDVDDYGGNMVPMAAELGFDAISPVHGTPFGAGVGDPAYVPFVTPAMVREAHAAGLLVVPYTVDRRATMTAFVDLGVDGFITNYPDLARAALGGQGIALPDPIVLA